MHNIEIETFLNGLVFIYVMVRHADHFASSDGRLALIAFLLLVFGANALLMLDRFAVLESIARASGIALLMGAGVYVLAIWNVRQRRRKAAKAAAPIVTAADRPAAPPGPAP